MHAPFWASSLRNSPLSVWVGTCIMSNARPISRRKARNSSCVVESIESRLLMSGHSQDVGTLNGRFFRHGSVFGSDKDQYQFEMPRAGKIDVQLSRLIGTGTMTLKDSNGDAIATAGASTKDRRITFNASSAGDFELDVQADQHQFAPAVFYTL